MVPPCHTAGYLEVNDTKAQAIAADDFADNVIERGVGDRRRHIQLPQRAFEALKVRSGIGQPAIFHPEDFVHAIGKLIAAVLDMDYRFVVRQVFSVHIDDA